MAAAGLFLSAALLVISYGGAGAFPARSSSDTAISVKATPSVQPSPTQTPSAVQVLAQAARAAHAQGSVSEQGSLSSTDDKVFDGDRFTESLSWRQRRFHDHVIFSKPIDLAPSIRHVRAFRRIVVGRAVALHTNHHWYCTTTSLAQNQPYWASPTYRLDNPKTTGAAVVSGQKVWVVQGKFTGHSRRSVSRFSVQVYANQVTYLFVRATETGTIQTKGVGGAQVRGQVQYSGYGQPVGTTIPPICDS